MYDYKTLNFHRQYDVSRDSYDLWIIAQDNQIMGSQDRLFLNPLTWTRVKAGVMPKEPMAPSVSDPSRYGADPVEGPDLPVATFLQSIMDFAWEQGMRPKGFDERATEPQLAALRYHLEDMRKLAKVK